MQITVILVNYHSSADLLEAVASLEESTIPKNFERKVIVVDNDSTPETWEKIQILEKYKDIELLKSEKNLGFTGANNLAIKKNPNSDFYLLLNPDTIVDKNFLVELLKPFVGVDQCVDPGGHTGPPLPIGLSSPKIYFYPGYEFHKNRYKKSDLGKVIWYGGGIIDWENVTGFHKNVDVVDSGLRRNDTEKTDFCTGCCLLISKQVIEKIGLLDEKLFFSWEDTDYSVRARRAGFEVVYVPNSIIWHKNANTSGGAGSPIQDFYQTRNRLLFAFRYAKPKVKLLLLWQLLKTADLNRLKAILSALWPTEF